MTNIALIWGYVQAGIIFQLLVLSSPYLHAISSRAILNQIKEIVVSAALSPIFIVYLCGRSKSDLCVGWQPLDFFIAFLIFFNIVYLGALYVDYKKILYPMLNEYRVYSISLVILYLIVSGQVPVHINVLTIIAFFCILSAAINVLHFRLPPLLKVLLYLWFILCSLIIFITQNIVAIVDLLQRQNLHQHNFMEYFFIGMLTVYLFINIMGILEFWPFPGKKQKWADRQREIQNHIRILFERYHDVQSPVLFTTLYTIFVIAIFVVDYYALRNSIMSIAIILLTGYVFDKSNLRSKLTIKK